MSGLLYIITQQRVVFMFSLCNILVFFYFRVHTPIKTQNSRTFPGRNQIFQGLKCTQ